MQQNDSRNSNSQPGEGAKRAGAKRKWIVFLGATSLVVTGAVAGSLATVGVGAHAFTKVTRFVHHSHDPAEVAERINYKMGWVLQKLDATPEQEVEIKAIVDQGVETLMPMFQGRGEVRAAMLEMLTAESIDRDEVEAMRQSHLDLADNASAEFAELLVQVAEVLTPEQRAQVAEFIRERATHGGRHFGANRWQGQFEDANAASADGKHRL